MPCQARPEDHRKALGAVSPIRIKIINIAQHRIARNDEPSATENDDIHELDIVEFELLIAPENHEDKGDVAAGDDESFECGEVFESGRLGRSASAGVDMNNEHREQGDAGKQRVDKPTREHCSDEFKADEGSDWLCKARKNERSVWQRDRISRILSAIGDLDAIKEVAGVRTKQDVCC